MAKLRAWADPNELARLAELAAKNLPADSEVLLVPATPAGATSVDEMDSCSDPRTARTSKRHRPASPTSTSKVQALDLHATALQTELPAESQEGSSGGAGPDTESQAADALLRIHGESLDALVADATRQHRRISPIDQSSSSEEMEIIPDPNAAFVPLPKRRMSKKKRDHLRAQAATDAESEPAGTASQAEGSQAGRGRKSKPKKSTAKASTSGTTASHPAAPQQKAKFLKDKPVINAARPARRGSSPPKGPKDAIGTPAPPPPPPSTTVNNAETVAPRAGPSTATRPAAQQKQPPTPKAPGQQPPQSAAWIDPRGSTPSSDPPPTKQRKPPPIYLEANLQNYIAFQKEIANVLKHGQLLLKSRPGRQGYVLHIDNLLDWAAVQQYLDEQGRDT